MIELTAVLGGKLVRYPMSATFVIERRKGPKRSRFMTQKESINAAISRFHRAVDEKLGKVHLSACHEGTLIPLHKE